MGNKEGSHCSPLMGRCAASSLKSDPLYADMNEAHLLALAM